MNTPDAPEDIQPWIDIAISASPFGKASHIPAVPNLRNLYSRPKYTPPIKTPLAPEMIIPPDPKEIKTIKNTKCFIYIHNIVFKGYLDDNLEIQQINIKGFKRGALSRGIKKGFFIKGVSFYGKGHFHAHVLYDLDEKFKRKTGTYQNPYTIQLILSYPIRQPLWRYVGRIMDFLSKFEQACQIAPLRLSRIEIAADFSVKNMDGLTQCVYRSWGAKSTKPDGINPDEPTIYTGSNSKTRKDIIYSKDGHWHLEARWEHKNLKRTERYRFCHATILLLLIEMLKNMSLRYPDLYKLQRSPSYAAQGVVIWRYFLRRGMWATLDRMKKEFNLKNPIDKTTLHPLDAVFKKALIKEITMGLKKLNDSGVRLPSWASAAEIKKNADDKKFLTRLARAIKPHVFGKNKYKKILTPTSKSRHHPVYEAKM